MGGHTQHTSDPANVPPCSASYSDEFFLEDHFNVVLAIIDADILENDEDFLEQTKTTLQKVSAAETSTILCTFCDKVCLS